MEEKKQAPQSPHILVISLDADKCLLHVRHPELIDLKQKVKFATERWKDSTHAAKKSKAEEDESKANVDKKTLDELVEQRNQAYQTASSALISSNRDLIKHIVDKAIEGDFDEVIFMVGSQRQCAGVDAENAINNKNGSFFPALTAFSKEVDRCIKAEIDKRRKPGEGKQCDITVRVDPYLLSDDHHQQTHGTEFSKPFCPPGYYMPGFYLDRGKLTILQSQTNKTWIENEGAVIDYCFYDDNEPDILDQLGGLHAKESVLPALTPVGLKVSLHHYAGGDVTLKASFIGKGRPDDTYPNSVKLILEHSGYDTKSAFGPSEEERDRKNVIKNLDVTAFLQAREQHWNDTKQGLKGDALKIRERCERAFDMTREKLTENALETKEQVLDMPFGRSYAALLSSLKTYANVNRQNALGEALLDLHSSLSADIEKQRQANAKLADLNKSSAVAICAATVNMLNQLNQLPPSASVEAKIDIIKNYDAACREIPGSREFAHIIKAVVIAALCFALYSVVLMGIFDFMGGADLISEFLSGFIDIVKGHMTDAAVSVIVTQISGLGLTAIAGYLFFKPDKITAVVDAAKDVVYAQQSISAPKEQQSNAMETGC